MMFMKWYKKKVFFCLITIVVLVSCQSCQGRLQQHSMQKSLLDSLHRVDTTQMKSAFLERIHQYIQTKPNVKSFILQCFYVYEDRGILSNGVIINNDIFLIIPAFQYAFEVGEWSINDVYPNHYFLMNDKIIFVCSRWDACFQQQNARKIYEKLVPTPKILYGDEAAFIMVEHEQDRASFLADFKKFNLEPLTKLRTPVKFDPPKP